MLEALHRGTDPVVRPWTNMVRDLSQACERAELPRCTANDLRRTFASWLIQGGVSNRIVADLIGHGTTPHGRQGLRQARRGYPARGDRQAARVPRGL